MPRLRTGPDSPAGGAEGAPAKRPPGRPLRVGASACQFTSLAGALAFFFDRVFIDIEKDQNQHSTQFIHRCRSRPGGRWHSAAGACGYHPAAGDLSGGRSGILRQRVRTRSMLRPRPRASSAGAAQAGTASRLGSQSASAATAAITVHGLYTSCRNTQLQRVGAMGLVSSAMWSTPLQAKRFSPSCPPVGRTSKRLVLFSCAVCSGDLTAHRHRPALLGIHTQHALRPYSAFTFGGGGDGAAVYAAAGAPTRAAGRLYREGPCACEAALVRPTINHAVLLRARALHTAGASSTAARRAGRCGQVLGGSSKPCWVASDHAPWDSKCDGRSESESNAKRLLVPQQPSARERARAFPSADAVVVSSHDHWVSRSRRNEAAPAPCRAATRAATRRHGRVAAGNK